MITSPPRSATAELLVLLYQHVKTGADTVSALLPKVKSEDVAFKSALSQQLQGYEALAARIHALQHEQGEEGSRDTLMNKLSTKLGAAMDTLMDDSVSHLADTLIRRATAGMTEATRLLREYENTSASEASLSLARDVIRQEEHSIQGMKRHL